MPLRRNHDNLLANLKNLRDIRKRRLQYLAACLGGAAEYLDVDVLDLEALEAAFCELGGHQFQQAVVVDVLIGVVHHVVQVQVVECVDVEIHLVVQAHPVVVDAQVGELRQDVVNGCDGHLVRAAGLDLLKYHVGRCVP